MSSLESPGQSLSITVSFSRYTSEVGINESLTPHSFLYSVQVFRNVDLFPISKRLSLGFSSGKAVKGIDVVESAHSEVTDRGYDRARVEGQFSEF